MADEFNFDDSSNMPSWDDIAFQELAKMIGNMYKGLRSTGLSEREAAYVAAATFGEIAKMGPPPAKEE